jgi:pectin methylesterase-like acyl-CoA thioesterase
VRPAGTGSYNLLSPRQPITPAPYALFATNTTPYKYIVTVAKSGGQFTTITAALNSITDNSAANRYLIRVAPGVYTEKVTMKEYIDIEGSGIENTRITYPSSPTPDTGTVVGANFAELRFLTVENTGGTQISIAIYNNSASPSLFHIHAKASGALYPSPNVSNREPNGTGVSNYGMYNTNASSPRLDNVTVTASGDLAGDFYTVNVGMFNIGSGTAPRIQYSTISATGGDYNYGVDAANSGSVYVDSSKITGSNNTIFTGSGTAFIGASQLSGGEVSGTGIKCVATYDENYNSPGLTTCP